jgi:DNA invertase Pin-like site-specific DNA recombinase
MKSKRVALYLRVSTTEQTVENQRRELFQAAERHGWEIVAEFVDEGISGSRGRDRRPGFDKLCKGVARRDFDMVAAWSVDRLSRSVQHLVGFLDELKAKGVGIFLLQQGIDSSTPAGKALLQMCSVFSELERALIVERVNAGLQRARAQGKRLGRPRVPAATEAAIRASLAAGTGILKTAREHGVGSSVVQRIRGEMGALDAR